MIYLHIHMMDRYGPDIDPVRLIRGLVQICAMKVPNKHLKR